MKITYDFITVFPAMGRNNTLYTTQFKFPYTSINSSIIIDLKKERNHTYLLKIDE